MISVRIGCPAGRVQTLKGILLDTKTVVSVKLCMIIVLIEVYPFIPLVSLVSMTVTIF